MDVEPTRLPGVLVLQPRVFGDDRGLFFESWNARTFAESVGAVEFVQDNHSRSSAGVVRGLHYQLPPSPQGKLVRCGRGAVWDVAVDLRPASPTFRQWVGVELTDDNHRQLWIPPGFGHGFVALTEQADLLYKASGFYDPDADRSIAWDDPDIGIDWPVDGQPTLSAKDATAPRLVDADLFPQHVGDG